MTTYAFKTAATSAAIALLGLGSAAHAGDLYDAYTIPNNTQEKGIASYNGALSSQTGGFVLPRAAVGMAAGADSLFISSLDSPTNYLERYDLTGAQIDSLAIGPTAEAGALAFGGNTLYAAFETFSLSGLSYSVSSLNSDLDFDGVFSIDLPTMATGLAYGDGEVFVACDSTLARYDLTGQLISSYDFGSVSLGALTYGAGQLFAAYQSGGSYGYASVDPATWLAGGANVSTAGAVKSLAFGDGGVFASFEHGLAKYDLDGNQLASIDTGRVVNGPLAFLDPASAAPEPSAWALMIVGFGAAGAALRQRRRLAAVRT